MSDEPSFDFLAWEELPVGVRRNRKKMYNYLVSVLGGDTPTPPGTGTVTVTCQDSEEQPLKAVAIYLCNTNQLDLEDDSNFVAIEDSGLTGTVTLTIYDTATHQPTEETAIPFGSYYLFATKDGFETYSSALTVDGDETVTITLTE